MNAPTVPAYKLNPELAREGDNQGSQRITENGGYPGVFTKAKHLVAGTGAVGIEFGFEAVDGSTAYFQLYTKNKDGDAIFGEKQLMALMTCLKIKSMAPQQAMIEEYDFNSKQVQKVKATVYPELMNKPIGIVFQKEHYIKNNGDNGERMLFFAAFDTQTKQTANEILDQKPAERLEKLLANLKDKNSPPVTGRTTPANTAATQNQVINNDFDDEIPF